MNQVHVSLVLAVLTLTLPQLSFAKSPPKIILDKVLESPETIENVTLPAGTHVVVTETRIGGSDEFPHRRLAAKRANGNLQIGPIEYLGDPGVEISYGTAYFHTNASNIGDHQTHHSTVQLKDPGYTIGGVMARSQRFAGVLLSGNDSKHVTGGKPQVSLFCQDIKRSTLCFGGWTRVEDLVPILGHVEEDIVLDGVQALAGDYLYFRGDGHPAHIIGYKFGAASPHSGYRGRRIGLTLNLEGQPVFARLYAHTITFNRNHQVSVVCPTYGQELFGIPLGEPGSIEHEAIVIRPDGSYTVAMRKDAVHVFNGIPLQGAGYGRGLEFDSQGFLKQAELGAAYVFDGYLLQTGMTLGFERGNLRTAITGQPSWAVVYAFDGELNDEQLFVHGTMHFNDAGKLERVEGTNQISNIRLVEEYRRTNRVIRKVVD